MTNGRIRQSVPTDCDGRTRFVIKLFTPPERQKELVAKTWRYCFQEAAARAAPVVGRKFDMLGWAVTFLVVALVAALLGFGGIAGTAMEAAKLVFFVAIVLFAISAVIGLMRGRSSTL